MKPTIIAVAGKGGTGKTTICGLLIDYLAKNGYGPLLAVDADPNSNLNEVLGVDVDITLGDIRENMVRDEENPNSPKQTGMTKQEYAEYMFSTALAEGDDYDMLVMGRTQGQGCYCYVNGVLKSQIDKYMNSYRYMVVDNEAGLEHISRGTLPHIDILLLVSDCSRRGVQAIGRIAGMVRDLKLNPATMKLIINRAPDGVVDAGVMEEIDRFGLDLIGAIPQDETVFRFDCDGKPTSKVPEDDPARLALTEIVKKLNLKK